MKIWNKCSLVVLAGPISLWMYDLYPPLWNGSFLFNSVFTITVCAIACMIAKNKTIIDVKSRQKYLYAAIICFIFYAMIYMSNVGEIQQRQDEVSVVQRYISGFEVKSISMASKSDEELIELYGDPLQIWTKESVVIVSASMFLIYNLGFFLLIISVAKADKH